MEKILDQNGKVILRYYQPMPKQVKIGDKTISFDSQYGISLAFVDDSDVEPLLSHLGGCCGNKRQVIFLATEIQYEHWKTGNGGRK